MLLIKWFKGLKWYGKLFVFLLFSLLLSLLFNYIEKSKMCNEACIYTYYTMGGSAKVYIVIPHKNPSYCFHILDAEKNEKGGSGKAFLATGQPKVLSGNIDFDTKFDNVYAAFKAGLEDKTYWVPLSTYYYLAGNNLQDNKSGENWDVYCSCKGNYNSLTTNKPSDEGSTNQFHNNINNTEVPSTENLKVQAKNTLINFLTSLSNRDISKARLYATQESSSMLQFVDDAIRLSPQNKKNNVDISNLDISEPTINNDEAIITVTDKKSGDVTDYKIKKEGESWKVKFDKETLVEIGEKKMEEQKKKNEILLQQQESQNDQSSIEPNNENKIEDKSNNEINDQKVYEEVDVEPMFPGGDDAFITYVTSNFNMYNTDMLYKSYKSFEVTVDLIIDKNGRVREVKSASNVGFGVEAEFIRVIKELPKFIPAQLNGQNVAYHNKNLGVTFYK